GRSFPASLEPSPLPDSSKRHFGAPKQYTVPFSVPMTRQPLPTAGDADPGPSSFTFCTSRPVAKSKTYGLPSCEPTYTRPLAFTVGRLDPGRSVEDVQDAVAPGSERLAADDGRRAHDRAAVDLVLPLRLAVGAVQAVERLVLRAEQDGAVAEVQPGSNLRPHV